MTDLLRSPRSADGDPPATDYTDSALVELVDALVEAVDQHRCWEIDRLRSALEPFGACALFDSELRLRGTTSPVEACICGGEVW